MASTYTSNLVLRKPEHRDPETYESWDQVININMDKIDAGFGNRVYTEQNYILNSDSHSTSLNKLDMKMYDIELLTPTADQKAALVGPAGHAPNVGNPYVTASAILAVAKKAVIAPEFAGAVFWDGGVPSTGGALTSDWEAGAAYAYNHYKWLSSALAYETYWIITRWKVPESFLGFETTPNRALIIDIATEDTGADTYVAATIFKDGTVLTTSSAGPISSTIAGTWYTEKEFNSLLYFDATDPVLALIGAGDILCIMVAMSSQNSKYVKVGDITIQYTG